MPRRRESGLRRFAAEDRLERAPGLELLARGRIALDDEAGAAAAVAELQAIADRVGTPPPLRASADFAAGALEFARGHFEFARRHFEDAVDRFARSGCPFEAGRSCLQLARSFDALGRPAPARAEALVARQALADLGATRLFPDMPRGISELARVTKPGGVC